MQQPDNLDNISLADNPELVSLVRRTAVYNARLAWLLWSARGRLRSHVYPIRMSFPTDAAGQTIKAATNYPMRQDAWITNILYSARMPNAFAGSPYKAQYDEYTKRNPYLDIQLQTSAGTPEVYWLTDEALPLEFVANAAAGGCNTIDVRDEFWVVSQQEIITVFVTLTRDLSQIDGSSPFEVNIGIRTLEPIGCYVRGGTDDKCLCELAKAGVFSKQGE